MNVERSKNRWNEKILIRIPKAKAAFNKIQTLNHEGLGSEKD